MKRWNIKGSRHAKVRMAELRDAKRRHFKRDLIAEYERIAGCERGGWWSAAQAAGLKPGCGQEMSIAFLLAAIKNIKNILST